MLEKQIRSARSELAGIEREYGAAADNTEQQRPSMRGFKIAQAAWAKSCAQLIEQRRALPELDEVCFPFFETRRAEHIEQALGLTHIEGPSK